MKTMWMGLTVIVDDNPPSVLRMGPHSIVVTPKELYGIATNDSAVVSAVLRERQAYEQARAA
jgi:hypothetical protein